MAEVAAGVDKPASTFTGNGSDTEGENIPDIQDYIPSAQAPQLATTSIPPVLPQVPYCHDTVQIDNNYTCK